MSTAVTGITEKQFYSPDKGEYVPAATCEFIQTALNNDLINAKQDIFRTACSNYAQGFKTSTTVNQLYKKYGKSFPEFTKEYLNEAVHKSILKYLENEV